MPFNIELTDECEELLLDDYDELRAPEKVNTEVEDEMLRNFLQNSKEAGFVKSFSKKEYMTLEA